MCTKPVDVHFKFTAGFSTLGTLPAAYFVMTKALAYLGQELSAFGIPNLCETYTKFGKCSYWERCDFLHLMPQHVKTLLADRICLYHGTIRPSRSFCKLNHDMRKLKVPEEFIDCNDQPGKNELVPILRDKDTNEEEEIARKYLAPTQGLFNGRNDLCEDRWCDMWHECPSLHLVEQYWKDFGPERKFTPHSYLSLPSFAPSSSSAPPQSNGTVKPSKPAGPAWGNNSSSGVAVVKARVPATHQKPSSSSSSPLAGSDGSDTSAPSAPEEPSNLDDFYRDRIVKMLLTSPGDLVPKQSFPANPTDGDAEILARAKEVFERWTSRSARYRHHYKAWEQSPGDSLWLGKDDAIMYNPQLQIGAGGTSVVYLGLMTCDGTEIAVKLLSDSSTNENVKVAFTKEVDALKHRAGIPGVIHYYTASQITIPASQKGKRDTVERCFAFELMESNVQTLVEAWKKKQQMGTPVHFLTCQYVIGSVLLTLAALRSKVTASWTVHRDIKPANIQIDAFSGVRLIDFGTAKNVDWMKDTQINTNIRSTVAYAPPESNHTPTSDLYSLGLVLRFLFTGGDPVPDLPPTPITILADFPHKKAALEHLIENLVKKEPTKRAFWENVNARQNDNRKIAVVHLVLSHPFFWDDKKATYFLAALGEFYEPRPSTDPQDGLDKKNYDIISAIIETYCYGLSTSNWRDLIDERIWDAMKKTPNATLKEDYQLLRLIRNCTRHPRFIPTEIRSSPYFLHTFPTLAVTLWVKLLPHTALRNHDSLRPYFYTPFTPTLDLPADHHKLWF